jgi:hypothetical protein
VVVKLAQKLRNLDANFQFEKLGVNLAKEAEANPIKLI